MTSLILDYLRANIDIIPYKTLRPDEHDLSNEDKLTHMDHLLTHDPGLFLSKWGKYLDPSLLDYFQSMDDYEVKFHLSQLQAPVKKNVRNRRYEYLKRYLRNSEYFSDEAMQLRDPFLFDVFVRQHQPEEIQPFEEDVTLVERILGNIDRQYVDEEVKTQKIREEEQFQEEEEDSDDEESDVLETEKDREAFREEQRMELVRLLEERFIAGKDDFNYDEVDNNEAYDDLNQLDQDMQDKYFDSDE
ncbi:coiled-coil domain-containing protein-domain-containing protein [Pilobolus umbonatus]|nr:coiled-coil domain-containing protein-domain-containing protein [Pilobolus umbonatus]